jgi:hypothetical protein
MFEILFAIFFGAFGGTMVQKQISYCECFRDDFKGAYCESIKAKGIQGSCHK